MANKFFYNRVYNTKRTIINVIIIGVCIIGVIICFIATRNFQGKNLNENSENQNAALTIKPEVTHEINEDITNDIFFSKIENVDVNTIEVIYPEGFDISIPGSYNVGLMINNKKEESILTLVDTTQPVLTLKNIGINVGKSYNVNDFVESCSDNSNTECIINYDETAIDQDNNKIDFSKFKDVGTYNIKISAKDIYGNETIQNTKLVIKGKNETVDEPIIQEPISPKPTNCKYGDSQYDKDSYLLLVDITDNGCAISLDLYKDSTMLDKINNIMNTESTKIKKDIEKLNLTGTLALNRKINAIVNTTGDGIVGYELRMTVTLSNDKNTETVVDYKLDKNGNRLFITNPYNLK